MAAGAVRVAAGAGLKLSRALGVLDLRLSAAQHVAEVARVGVLHMLTLTKSLSMIVRRNFRYS